jgi:peptidoglycan/xylan/chitin deacetylase (PgdA/CDA1 family)
VLPHRAVGVGATLYYGALRALGVTALKRRLRDAGPILCYHNVVTTADDEIGDLGLHLPRGRFEWQMRWLAAHYDVISLREFINRLTSGASLRRTAAITFDDGYAGVFENAVPVLDRLGLPATVFLVAEAVGKPAGFWWDGPAAHRPANWATIRTALGRGIDLGAHTATHPSLPPLTDAQLEHEVVASRAIVHRATGIWPEFFAYPYGHWDARVRERVHSAGYRGGLTLDPGLNDSRADLWALRRINVPAGISDSAFQAWAGGLRTLRRAG